MPSDSYAARGGRIHKDGGGETEGYQDPESKKMQGWNWRPLADVHQQLGNVSEIPSHVAAFGNFMDETARRAATKGLTPRDLIKAYTITRSSIQRESRSADKARAAGLILPPDFNGQVRPEGAFGEWLHSPMGRRYLDAAEAGRVDHDAVADAIKTMTPFGLHTEAHALPWAATNLPQHAGRVSDMVARAMQAKSSPEEWRDFIRGVSGIGNAKAGFMASLLGRGDQPTLDARQVVLHTGQPTKEAKGHLARAGHEAVDRLAARQEAMGLKTPEGLEPYYQHLAHHTIWDKIGDEQTTHQDVINAMRHAASGGAIEPDGIHTHPLAVAMREIGLPGLDGNIEQRDHKAYGGASIGSSFKNGGSPEDDKYREYMKRILNPYSEEHYEKAKEIAKNYKVKDISYSGFKSHPIMPSQVTTSIKPIPGVNPKNPEDISWGNFYDLAKGGTLFSLGGDRSNLGRLTHINGKPLAWPVDLHAGTKYQTEPNPGVVWANDKGAAAALRNNILRAAERGPVYGAFAPMGPMSVDSSKNMTDVLFSQIANSDISKEYAKKFDELLKNGVHVFRVSKKKTLEEKIKEQKKVASSMQEWPGIMSAEKARDFAFNKMSGEERAAMVKMMDAKMWLQEGFPSISATRAAITDPDLLAVSGNMIGGNVVQLDPSEVNKGNLAFEHSTYSEPTAGKIIGKLPFVERQAALPDFTQERLTNPKYDRGDNPLLIHPYSPNAGGRAAFRGDTELRQGIQPVNERMLESIAADEEQKKKYGFNKGGIAKGTSTVDRALSLTRHTALPGRQNTRGRP
jgi:hypothetical protein